MPPPALKKTAYLLGWAGVVPFAMGVGFWLYGGVVSTVLALQFTTIYAGCIVVFLGAVHWGFALGGFASSGTGVRGNPPILLLIWSVLPAVAVAVIMMLPPIARLPLLVLGFILCWGVDFWAYRRGFLPGWYMGLRHQLSVAVVGVLVILIFSV